MYMCVSLPLSLPLSQCMYMTCVSLRHTHTCTYMYTLTGDELHLVSTYTLTDCNFYVKSLELYIYYYFTYLILVLDEYYDIAQKSSKYNE